MADPAANFDFVPGGEIYEQIPHAPPQWTFDYIGPSTLPPPAPPEPQPVLYGQTFDSVTRAIPGARDLAWDYTTRTFKRNATGGLALTQSHDAVRQAVERMFALVEGEWFSDTRAGFPWFGQIFVKRPNLPALRDLFKQRIEAVPGVASVVRIELTVDKAARKLRVEYEATDDLGELFRGDFTR